ncbi:hypothetical protein [uncultured Nitrosomonas sp.]|uniref:hypothetical protein n=1 Tax=uncultured Nitrosomonas sp. TaxID=156424 RepID=UPI0025D2F489|nr:hypothetical protein [uncultured Nitrosomonas sp.]
MAVLPGKRRQDIYAELAMQRYKRILSNAMKVRVLPQQKIEAWISASALNRITNLGMPVSVQNLVHIRNWELSVNF